MVDVAAELKIPKSVCLVCGKSTVTRCSGCKHAFYCGKGHSKKDWDKHKNECNSTSKSSPSEPLTHDAILFPANEMLPRAVKIPLKRKLIESFFGESPVPHQILARNPWPGVTQPMWICRWYPGGPGLPDNRILVAFHNDNCCNDGSPMNKAIYFVTNIGRGGKHLPHAWADDVFVLRKNGSHDPEFQDVVWEEDMPVLQSWFRRYGEF